MQDFDKVKLLHKHMSIVCCHWNLSLIVILEFILHNSVTESARCCPSQNPNVH